MEMQTIQTVFETVQAQMSNLRLRDQEIHGISEQVDWTDGHWKKYSVVDERISEQFRTKIYLLVSDSFLCLGGKCPDHPEAAQICDKKRIDYFVESPAYRPFNDITGKTHGIRMEDLRGENINCISRVHQRHVFGRRRSTVSVPR